MPQSLVPTSTLANYNTAWSAVGAATLHEATDETIASANDGTDYALGPTQKSTAYLMALGMATPGETPNSAADHIIKARCRRESGLVLLSLTVQVYEDLAGSPVLIATLAMTNIGGSYATSTYTLTSEEVAAITDYSDLAFVVFAPGTGSFVGVRLTALEFEVPDAPITLELTRIGSEAYALAPIAEARSTRQGVEVLGDIQTPRVTRATASAIAAVAQPRTTRVTGSVISDRAAPALTRLGAEVYSTTGLLSDAAVTRILAEAVGDSRVPRVSRMSAHAIGPHTQPRVSRTAVEVIASPSDVRATRLGAEVYAITNLVQAARMTREAVFAIADSPVPRVTRAGIEALASWSAPALTRLGVEAWATTGLVPSARLSRTIAEVIGGRAAPRVSRVLAEAIADRAVGDAVNITRLAAEIWARTSQENVLHRIDCGSADDYIDVSGNTWDADRDFTGGFDFFSTEDPILNTNDPALYQTERHGTFSYALPVPDGTYTVRLHFAEIFHQSIGQRVFDVAINGTVVENDLDIYALVGHDFALVRSHGTTATSGTGIAITFTPSVDTAKVSAIEVISSEPAGDSAYLTRLGVEAFGPTEAMQNDLRFSRLVAEVWAEAQYPVRVTRMPTFAIASYAAPRISRVIAEVIAEVGALDEVILSRLGAEAWARTSTPSTIAHHRIRSGPLGAYVDSFGNTWDADRDFVGTTGTTVSEFSINGTPDPDLYIDERYGIAGALWGYVLDVPGPGTYRVRVHLAEIYWNEAGARLFDIEINGVTVESDIDIWAEVGIHYALVKEYQVTVGAGAASTISVYFRATVDAGKCSAIEILQDAVVEEVDLTRLGAEVFGRRAESLLTRLGAEVFATTITDTILATRVGGEVIGDSPAGVNVTRAVAEVIASDPRYARASRVIAEVIASGSVPTRLSRFACEVFGLPGDNDPLRCTRLVAEVFGKAGNTVRASRIAVEAFARWIESHDAARATRIGAEVFARVLGQTPFSPLDLAASDIFLANWRDEVVLDSSWLTDITQSDEGLAEDRIALVDRPYRVQEVTLTGLDLDQAHRLVLLASRHGQGRLTVPLYPDFSRVTAPSGGTVIFCDTTKRRFFRGGRVLIHGWASGRAKPGGAAYGIIDQVTANALVLTDDLPFVYDAGARVYPVIDTEVVATSEIAIITDEIAELALRVSEVVGQSALPPTVVGGTMPPGVPTFRNEPVFQSRADWNSRIFSRVVREGDQADLGRGVVTKTQGDRPRLEYSAQYLGLDRGSVWGLIEFFDSRRGRTDPFYFIAHDALWHVVEVGTYHVDVVPINASVIEQQAGFRFFGLRLRTGQTFIREITEVREIDASRWRVAFTEALPAIAVSNVHRMSSGHHVRFVADVVRERWSTDEVGKVTLGMIDLLEEGPVEVEIPPPPSTYDGLGSIANLHLWVDASKGLFNGQKIGSRFNYPIATNRFITAWDDARHDPDPDTASDPCLFGRHPDDTQSPKSKDFTPGVNRGLRAAISTPSSPFTETKLYLMTGNVHAENSPGDSLDLPYWDDDLGLTVVWCGSLAGKKTDTSFFRSYGSHDWNYTALKLYATKGVDNPPSWATYPDVSDFEGVQILMARWSPAFSVRVWQHGLPIGQSTTSPGNLTALVDGHGASEPSSIVACELGTGSWTNAFMIFKRSLPMSELNAIGAILARRYGAAWTDILS